jgi:RecJ-like exonuclease
MSRCFICHGLGTNAIAPGQCETCHPPGMRQEPETHLASNWVPVAHSKAALEDRFECLTCHEQATCNSCHGLEMPHDDTFKEQTHPLVFFENPRLCENCHAQPVDQRDFCDTCHHPEGPKDVAWRAFHPTAVTELGAGTCFQCHSDQTCRTCHTKGVEDLSADEALLTTGPSGPSGG